MSMQGWMKLLGAVFIVSGAAGCGAWFANRYRQRIAQLEQLKQMIVFLKGQILYANAPLSEALEAVGKRMEGVLGRLFLEVAGRIEQRPGEPFRTIWKESLSCLEGNCALTKSDRQTLETLGEHLGFLDRESQERTLLLYLEQVDDQLKALKEHRQERCRLYTSLGIMGGLFLAVILV